MAITANLRYNDNPSHNVRVNLFLISVAVIIQRVLQRIPSQLLHLL